MSENIKKRLTDVWFWVGIVSAILAAGSINPQDLTTWSILQEKLLSIITNPYKLGLVVIALISFWNNPTTETNSFLDDK